MAMAIIRGRFKLRLGHSAFAKYVVFIRLGQYSFWPYDTQPFNELHIEKPYYLVLT